MKLKNVIGGMLLMASSLVVADDIKLLEPGYGGNGCPQFSANATLSPDNKSLSILFDQYIVEVTGRNKLARKSCNISIPIHVPQGLSLSVIGVDYRGYNGLPRGADSVLSVEYFFAGISGPKAARTFVGDLDDEYLVHHDLLAAATVWSPCGQDVNLRINSSMRVRTTGRAEQALATVDSVDLTAGMIYHLQWKSCRR